MNGVPSVQDTNTPNTTPPVVAQSSNTVEKIAFFVSVTLAISAGLILLVVIDMLLVRWTALKHVDPGGIILLPVVLLLLPIKFFVAPAATAVSVCTLIIGIMKQRKKAIKLSVISIIFAVLFYIFLYYVGNPI